MKITIKTLSGQNFPLEVEPEETVLQIKEKIFQVKQLEVASQKLLHKGTLLEDNTTLGQAGIQEGAFLVVMVNVKKAPTQAPVPQVPAQQVPPAAQQPPVHAPSTQAPVQIPGGASALLSGAEYEAAIENMISMGFPKEECQAAMKAAFNNPDRAIEYLLNGIPASAPISAPQPSVQPTQPGTNPNPVGGAGLAGLAQHPQLAQLRQMFQTNPQGVMQILPQILQQIQQTNPQLAASIQANPELFLQLLVGQGAPAPPANQIQLTPQEAEQIETIMAMGFTKTDSLEAYLACDKNVEAALNYLFERQQNGELLSQHIQNEQNNPENHPHEDEGPEEEGDDDDIYG